MNVSIMITDKVTGDLNNVLNFSCQWAAAKFLSNVAAFGHDLIIGVDGPQAGDLSQPLFGAIARGAQSRIIDRNGRMVHLDNVGGGDWMRRNSPAPDLLVSYN